MARSLALNKEELISKVPTWLTAQGEQRLLPLRSGMRLGVPSKGPVTRARPIEKRGGPQPRCWGDRGTAPLLAHPITNYVWNARGEWG